MVYYEMNFEPWISSLKLNDHAIQLILFQRECNFFKNFL